MSNRDRDDESPERLPGVFVNDEMDDETDENNGDGSGNSDVEEGSARLSLEQLLYQLFQSGRLVPDDEEEESEPRARRSARVRSRRAGEEVTASAAAEAIAQDARGESRVEQSADAEPTSGSSETELARKLSRISFLLHYDRAFESSTIRARTQALQMVRARELSGGPRPAITPLKMKAAMGQKFLPSSSSSTILRRASSRIYCGQFTPSGNLFYCAGQDWTLHVFDSRDPLKMQHLADIPCVRGQWTVTDATADQEGRWLAYASITPVVYLTPTGDSEGGLGSRQVALDFDPNQSLNFGLWSVRFSADARELVAGASDGNIFVYDIERKEVLLRIDGHDEDVNAVCFADESTNVLFSGSDDSFVKVWDRRSLRSNRPSGVLMGHTEGITYVDTKGDGRYLLSTAKDQTSKLFDVRRMYDADDFQRRWHTRQGKTLLDKRLDWDYRYMAYPGPPTHRHPEDRSVQTYRGHKVLKTLIRSRFTPFSYTGQGYVYAGSADGKVRFYDLLSGECVNTVDVRSVVKSDPELSEHTTGHGRYLWGRRSRGSECVTRDVSMHPHLPVLVTTSWCGPDGEAGAVIAHGPSDGPPNAKGTSSPKRPSDQSGSESPTKKARGDGGEDEEGWMDVDDDDEDEDDDEEYLPTRRNTGLRIVNRGGRIYITR